MRLPLTCAAQSRPQRGARPLTPLPRPLTLPRSDVMLEKHYKGIVSRAAVETFWDEVSKRPRKDVRGARGA